MPNKGYRKYTPEELQTLQDLYQEMPLEEVAKRMGYKVNSLNYQLRQMGVTKQIGQVNKLHYMNLEPTVLAYTAGLIDGEGTVSIRKFRGKWKPTIRIANSSQALIDWLVSHINGPSTYVEKRSPVRVDQHRYFMFHINGLSHLPFYEALEPYMVIKKDRIQLVIEYCHIRREQSKNDQLTDRQQEIISTVRALNIKPSVQLADAT